MKHILVEGCDGSGKSTLVKNLEAAFKQIGHEVVTIHNGPFKTPIDAMEAYIIQRESANNKEVICIWDRAHLSEFVYGTIYRKVVPSLPLFQYVDSEFAADTLLIHCELDYDLIEKNWKSRLNEEMISDSHQLKAIYALYQYAVQKITDMRYLRYNYTLDSVQFFQNVCDVIGSSHDKRK